MKIDALYKRGLKLEYFTVGYNFLEAIASIFLAGIAGSIALIGFGFDSIIESMSGLILIWRLSRGVSSDENEDAAIEHKAKKICR